MNCGNHSNRPEHYSINLVRIMMLSALVFFIASSTFAQYQLRKTTTPTQQKTSITITDPTGNAAWEKGKRYTIKWTSEGRVTSVKIDLVDRAGNATSLVRMTTNSGKYAFTLARTVNDGDYKVRVSATDGKIVGEGSGMVSISSGTPSRPGTGGTEPSTPPPSYQPRTTTPLTPSKEPVQLGGSGQRTDLSESPSTGASPGELSESPSTGASPGELSEAGVVHREITTVPATDAHIEYIDAMSADGLRALSTTLPTVLGGVLFVSAPVEGAVWVAGNQYPIEWTSDDLSGDIKIDLVWWATSPDREVYPIVASTENDGTFDCLVPPSLGCKPEGFRVRVTSLDNQAEAYSPNMIVYTELVDMTCKIMNMKRKTDKDYYYVIMKEDEWLEFDICLRNNGTQASVTVPTVSVIIIKEPEEIVIHQEEWGFSGIHPRLWYMTPDPRKFDIRGSWADVIFRSGEDVDMEDGAYRVEVTVDPYNELGENPVLREDNKCVVRFEIK